MHSLIGQKTISFVGIAAFLLWVKTYIVYKLSFGITGESILQEIILFMNPLAFLLFVLGIATFLSEKSRIRYIVSCSFIISAVLYGNVVFYRFYNDFITFPVLFQTSNISDLGSSISELVSPADIWYFLDFFALCLIAAFKPAFIWFKKYVPGDRRFFYTASAGVLLLNLGLAEAVRPQLLTRTFDREILVKNIGTYNYHLYDAFLQTKSTAQRALADGSELADIQNYIHSNKVEPNEELFGAAKGKNLVIISMESTQGFVINRKINGKEITPFLNNFIKESFYFDNLYHQTGQGKTSDAEFLVENSLYPLGRGAVFFTNPQNTYFATPRILAEQGYYTAAMHANNKSFWNRDLMYKSLGYNRYYHLLDYKVTQENSIGWGLKDQDFFDQSLLHIKQMPRPFYAKLITLTNHFPYILDEENQFIDEFNSSSKTLNRYFPTVRYTDEALKDFIQGLKDSGLYDDTVIVLYGDHYGISENHNEAMGQYLGKEITPFEEVQLQKVPVIIHVPGEKGKTISRASGQVDLKPTILHLLGIKSAVGLEFGNDLLSPDKQDFAVLRGGNFVTRDYIYTKDTCYSKSTGQPADPHVCKPFIEKANLELQYSDQIVYGDLLRFFGKNSKQKSQ
ncbi:phosphoglycerol transferase MdoB-like AlkP superfamily enzyme [Peribacillus deserti]|uniref:Phosphoglycerol transferase MdoB-like AlkP superfamily enzyme n=1 Tax=Peribacillus deserti TaxID=673318 RepID=A0ABS2QJG6_9BACI|nr:LTA synthase family protein [Peribacillus deserti]MBM7693294.1 phosphoglycerol transferase MdoB-like AlkP superfamily enzyme [Peribacillus deserti]